MSELVFKTKMIVKMENEYIKNMKRKRDK